VCTVRQARRTLGIRPANLDHVASVMGIELNHHDALSDAEACARIVMAARKALAE
jgi:DNA polymerase-3 subunit epsilon